MYFFFCFYLLSRLSTENLKCLNRGDIGQELFKKKISHKNKRRNLNDLIQSNSTHIFCNKNRTVYEIDQLCERKGSEGTTSKRPCLLETGETIEL